MVNEILQYLSEHDTGEPIYINDCLKELLDNKPPNILIRILSDMQNRDEALFEGPYSWLGTSVGGVGYSLENTPIKGRILERGTQILEDKDRRKRQDELLEKQTDSLIKTNLIQEQLALSTIRLNDEIIPANFMLQKRIGNRTLLAIAVTALLSIATFITTLLERGNITQKQREKQSISLDSINNSLLRINSTLDKIIKDTVKNKIPDH